MRRNHFQKLIIILKAMMDRERKDELPQMQVDFIDHVCRPLYTTLSDSFPWIKPLLDGLLQYIKSYKNNSYQSSHSLNL